MTKAFNNFRKIEELDNVIDKQKAWLEDYHNITYSKAMNKKHFVKWATEPLFYDKDKFTSDINCIGRKKNRIIIEFDGDGDKAKEDFELTKEKLQKLGIGYIHSSHNSKKSDYLWVEFERDITTQEAKDFLCWVAPEGSEVDLNFASDNKVYPVLFALHWKYSNVRELPVKFFGGDQIDYDKLNIPKQKTIEKISVGEDGFQYKTYTKSDARERVLSLFHKKMFGEATEILVKIIEGNNHIYTTKVDKASEMYIYKDGIYIPEGESEIRVQLRNIMMDNYSEWLANQVLSKIRADTGIEFEEFFKEGEPYEIPVQNGILNIMEIELTPFTPEKIFFSKVPVEFIEGETCEKIDQFLSDVLASPEDIDVFYELAGFGLVKDYFMEKSFMFVGNGRNGKSKSIDLLKRLVGSFNCSSVPLSSLTSDSPFVQRLWKRFFNLAGDLSSKDLKETGMFKQLTGRDPISANRKYKSIVEFVNYAKLVFACNELPRVYDYSDGFWDRWILLEFPYKFVTQETYDNAKPVDKINWKIQNTNIIEEITSGDQLSGFLNMAIIGLHRLLKSKRFSYTVGTSEVKNKWIRMSDSFMAFCMDNLEVSYEEYVTKANLRRKYFEYCKKHHVSGVGDKSIKITLQEMFGVMEEYKRISPTNVNQDYCWTGIKFKNKGMKGMRGF